MKVSVESRHVPGLTGGVAGFLCGIRVCEWVYGVLTVVIGAIWPKTAVSKM